MLAELKPRLRGVSHTFAAVAMVVAGAILVALAPAAARVPVAVFAVCVTGMFGVSATYHRGAWGRAAERVLQRLDHAMIFLAIAGTYTPLCFGAPGGGRVLVLVWGAAVLGVLQSIFWIHAPRALVALLYLAVGWLIVPFGGGVLAAMPVATAALVLLGGVFYTTGAVIYARKRPDPVPRVFGFHEVFHALVIAGAAAHTAAVVTLL